MRLANGRGSVPMTSARETARRFDDTQRTHFVVGAYVACEHARQSGRREEEYQGEAGWLNRIAEKGYFHKSETLPFRGSV